MKVKIETLSNPKLRNHNQLVCKLKMVHVLKRKKYLRWDQTFTVLTSLSALSISFECLSTFFHLYLSSFLYYIYVTAAVTSYSAYSDFALNRRGHQTAHQCCLINVFQSPKYQYFQKSV